MIFNILKLSDSDLIVSGIPDKFDSVIHKISNKLRLGFDYEISFEIRYQQNEDHNKGKIY